MGTQVLASFHMMCAEERPIILLKLHWAVLAVMSDDSWMSYILRQVLLNVVCVLEAWWINHVNECGSC